MPGYLRTLEVKIRSRSYHTFEWCIDKSYVKQLQSACPTLILPEFLPIFVQRRADCDDVVKKMPDYVCIPIQRNNRIYVDLRLPKSNYVGGSLFEDVRWISDYSISVKKNTVVSVGDTVFLDNTIALVEKIEGSVLTLDKRIVTAHLAGWIADTEDAVKTANNIRVEYHKRNLPATYFVAGLGGPFQEKQFFLWQHIARVSCVFEGAATLYTDPEFTNTSWLSGDPVFIQFVLPTDIEFATFCHAHPMSPKTKRYEIKYGKNGHVFIGWFMRMETHASCIVSLARPCIMAEIS